MHSGELTVEAYAQALLSRISARDAKVKAWAYLDPTYILAEAKRRTYPSSPNSLQNLD